jgi:dynein heavy chain, axonemal
VQAIDSVIADVNAMLQGVASVRFNIFDRSMALEWHTVVHTFHEQNNEAKKATRNLINTSFRRLRSAEGAFELLQNFKKIKSKGAIKEQMESKLLDILDQFSREIDAVTEIFQAERCEPTELWPCANTSPSLLLLFPVFAVDWGGAAP